MAEVFSQAGEIMSCIAQDDEGTCFEVTYKHLINAIKASLRFSGKYLHVNKAFLQVNFVPQICQQMPPMLLMPLAPAMPPQL